MGIDKIKKKKPNQLVSKRKDGKRPGYYGSDDYGSGEDGRGGGGGGGGGGGNGNSDDYYNEVSYSPAPAPAPAPSYSVQDDIGDYATNVGSTASVAGGFEDDSSGDDPTELSVQDYIEDYATNVGKTANLGGGFEDDDTGESLYITKKPTVPYVSPTQTMKDEEPYYGYTPGPNTVTAQELYNLNRGLGDNDQQAATLANIQAINPIEKQGFFDSGIGSVLKTAGKIAAPILAPALLPSQLAKGYTTYNQARNISIVADLVTKGRTGTLPTLREAFTTFQGTGPKGPPTGFNDNDNDSGSDNIIPKNVIAKNVQKYSPAQINTLQKNRDLLQTYAKAGRLNEKGTQTLQQMNNIIEQYLV